MATASAFEVFLLVFSVGGILSTLEFALAASLRGSPVGRFGGSGVGTVKADCIPLERNDLAGVLGSAYNPRYMSIGQPPDGEESAGASDPKRETSFYRPFFVDLDFAREMDDAPAWEADHFVEGRSREERKRRSTSTSTPWECRAVVKWTDLGPDYFPRYLRSVECTKHDCWYGKFACVARSFAVKILRRKKGRCVNVGRREGSAGLPRELKELWVWEERAVNFCCDCAPV